ncbi:MAG: zinc ribbon domain-containing protein, partial [Candidatus Micrarchaeia archaeon]
LSQRTFICEACGYRNNRDINASQNTLDKALGSIKPTEGHSGSQACGDDVRPSARKAVAEEAGTIRVAS